MLPNIPGWLNYILLFAFYFLVAIGLNFVGGFHTDWRFIAMMTAFWSGGYLAKWSWFVETLPDGTKKTWHRFW